MTPEEKAKELGVAFTQLEPGQNLVARDAESDLYAAIDLVTKKIQAQLRKRHNKFKSRNHKVAASAKQALQAAAA